MVNSFCGTVVLWYLFHVIYKLTWFLRLPNRILIDMANQTKGADKLEKSSLDLQQRARSILAVFGRKIYDIVNVFVWVIDVVHCTTL